uniref:Uncharacterized protein n=1 Tax=Oryza brachyantha TaxID=4533 RepID=J3M6K0_ORYBR
MAILYVTMNNNMRQCFEKKDKMCGRIVRCQEQRDGGADGGREGDLKENLEGCMRTGAGSGVVKPVLGTVW